MTSVLQIEYSIDAYSTFLTMIRPLALNASDEIKPGFHIWLTGNK